MEALAARILGGVLLVPRLASAFLLASFLSLAARSLLLAIVDRGRDPAVILVRLGAAGLFLGAGAAYGLAVQGAMVWDLSALGVFLATALLFLVGLAFRRSKRGPGILAAASLGLVFVILVVLAVATLLPLGFVMLAEDRPVLLVDITGETRPEPLRWSPPNQPAREETLEAHRVIFRTPEGAQVAEAWIYGDEVAVKGRVLRLSPFLNAVGVPNLFELLFAHNGYRTAERHSAYPPAAAKLPPMGPLAVPRWWRPIQSRLLKVWEVRSSEGSPWAVRAVTTESTYFPLADPEGRPVRGTFRLVLTPGGLTSG